MNLVGEGKISSFPPNNPVSVAPTHVDDPNFNEKKVSSLVSTTLNTINNATLPIRKVSTRVLKKVTPQNPRKRNICRIVTYVLTGGLVIAGSLAIASKVSSLNISSYLAPLATPFAYLADKIFSSVPSNATIPLANVTLPLIHAANISNLSSALVNASNVSLPLVTAANISNLSSTLINVSLPLINATTLVNASNFLIPLINTSNISTSAGPLALPFKPVYTTKIPSMNDVCEVTHKYPPASLYFPPPFQTIDAPYTYYVNGSNS